MENSNLFKIVPERESKNTGFSKKLQNKIMEILKNPGINKADADNVFKSLTIPQYDPSVQAEVNLYTPEVLLSLISKELGYISIDIHDLPEIIRIIAEKIAIKESFNDFVISIGMGGSIGIPNVRTPAYLVPAIKTLETMHKLMEEKKIIGIPKVRVFKAENMASFVNGFDLARVQEVTKITFDFMIAFLNEFYPHLVSSFIFCTDRQPTKIFLNELEKQSDLLKNQESINEEITSITKMGSKHGGEKGIKNSLLYASAHPFYNQSVVNKKLGSLFQDESAQLPTVIIDHGGKPQGTFNKISRVLIEKNRGKEDYITPPVLHMLIRSGKIPVYYSARDGDLPLGQVLQTIDFNKLDKSTHKDYEEIFSLVSKEKFLQFVNTFNKNNEKHSNYEKSN
ncbi:MAG: hypothetical protein WC839_01995 [Candidatus Paceibacterota bacterium]